MLRHPVLCIDHSRRHQAQTLRVRIKVAFVVEDWDQFFWAGDTKPTIIVQVLLCFFFYSLSWFFNELFVEPLVVANFNKTFFLLFWRRDSTLKNYRPHGHTFLVRLAMCRLGIIDELVTIVFDILYSLHEVVLEDGRVWKRWDLV